MKDKNYNYIYNVDVSVYVICIITINFAMELIKMEQPLLWCKLLLYTTTSWIPMSTPVCAPQCVVQ